MNGRRSLPIVLLALLSGCGSTENAAFSGLFGGEVKAGGSSSLNNGTNGSSGGGSQYCSVSGYIPSPMSQDSSSLAYDGTNLWVIQGSMVTGKTRFNRVDPTNGSVLSYFDVNRYGPYSDAAWDGSAFWITDYNGLYRMGLNGSIIAHLWDPEQSGKTQDLSGAVAFVTPDLWVKDRSADTDFKISKITTSGVKVLSLTLPVSVNSLSSDGVYLWVGSDFDTSNSGEPTHAVVKVDPATGSIRSSCKLDESDFSAQEISLAWGDDSVWVIQNRAHRILKIDVSGL